ncbi:hypothetical protein EVG20_g8170 [Dentipellis fragilis]|uniref:Uncharacterized protein n=1 Tax=Dentipellis fragilis TaxID=205917 RepID=A0A4Y9Y7Q4_9AGAM|nr:hypothetical protein EVG20_g8170 [Dentipellis fragilis]
MAHQRTQSARHLPRMPSSPLPVHAEGKWDPVCILVPLVPHRLALPVALLPLRLPPQPPSPPQAAPAHHLPRAPRPRHPSPPTSSLSAQPSLSPLPLRSQAHPPADDSSSPWRNLANYAAKHRAANPTPPVRPQITLDPDQELAALTSFMAALPQNVVPGSVDPAHPIDPSLVLDFDTRSPRAAAEIEEVVSDVWTRNPVVVFSKLHSPISREIKHLIYDMKLKPAPTVFEIDQRSDADVVAPMIYRLTGQPALPILLVGGKPVGTIDDIRDLIANGELKRMVIDAARAR